MSNWALPALLAGVLSYVGVRLIERFAPSLGLVDVPNERSSHARPRPRGGGAAIALATTVAVIVAPDTNAGGASLRTLLGIALFMSVVGVADDVARLRVWPRLLAQVLAAASAAMTIGALETLPLPPPANVPVAPWLGIAITVVWIVGVTNFFNFMDGADGLAGGQAVLTFAALAFALGSGSGGGLALVVATATAAFLLRNWYPARIFLGDVGSSFLGFLLATLPFLAPPASRSAIVWMTAASLALFLLDPVATLVRRARRRAPVGTAHREHAYQRLFDPARSHAPAVAGLLVAGAVLTLLAVGGFARPPFAWPAAVCAVFAFVIEWRMAARIEGRPAS